MSSQTQRQQIAPKTWFLDFKTYFHNYLNSKLLQRKYSKNNPIFNTKTHRRPLEVLEIGRGNLPNMKSPYGGLCL